MPRNPEFDSHVRAMFQRATFMATLGVFVDGVAEGSCETHLLVEPKHAQQDGFVHAGVLAAMADHTAGGAALTLVEAEQGVLTIEFKINFLRAARGERIECTAKVLKGGRSISVVEAEVFSLESGAPLLVAKSTVTLSVVSRPHTL